MFAAVAKVFPSDVAVKAAGEEMVDRAALRKALGAGVFVGVKFGSEGGGALAPMCAGERQELACYERGWELRPATAHVQEAITRLVAELSRRERER